EGCSPVTESVPARSCMSLRWRYLPRELWETGVLQGYSISHSLPPLESATQLFQCRLNRKKIDTIAEDDLKFFWPLRLPVARAIVTRPLMSSRPQRLNDKRSPGRGQRQWYSRPVPEHVTQASCMSAPPKQMLVVIGSGKGVCS